MPVSISIDINIQALLDQVYINHVSLKTKMNKLVEPVKTKIDKLNKILSRGNIELFRKNKLNLMNFIDTKEAELNKSANKWACEQEDINALKDFFDKLKSHLKRYNPPLKEESTAEREENCKRELQLCEAQQNLAKNTAFLDSLKRIKEQAHKRSKYGTTAYFVYARPETQYETREDWVQSQFLPKLYEHLQTAGIQPIWDKTDNFTGSNLSEFSGQIINKQLHIVIFGTESLRAKLLQDDKAIQFVEKLLKLKRLDDLKNGHINSKQTTIIPFVMTGTQETAYTDDFINTNFQGLTIRTWRTDDYKKMLFELISQLYGGENVIKWISQKNNINLSSETPKVSFVPLLPKLLSDSPGIEKNKGIHKICNAIWPILGISVVVIAFLYGYFSKKNNKILLRDALAKYYKQFQVFSLIYYEKNISLRENFIEPILADETAASITIADLFNPSAKKILINGKAGVGKSLLCRYLAMQWQSGALWNKRFEAVFWLNLAKLTRKLETDNLPFAEILRLALPGAQQKELSAGVIESFIDKNSDKVLFILDGFDTIAKQVKDQQPKQPVLAEFIIQVFNHPYVILTTRFAGVNRISDTPITFDRTIENTGFNASSITEYVKRFTSSLKNTLSTENRASAKDITSLLQTNAIFWDMAQTPIYLELLCSCLLKEWQEPARILTLTQLYQKISDKILSHSNEDMKPHLEPALAKLAYMSRTQPISERLLRKVSNDNQTLYNSLLSCHFLKSLDNEAHGDLEFIHSTFQEFWASRYLAELFITAENNLLNTALISLQQHKYDPNNANLWIFISGLLTQEAKLTANYKQLERFWQLLEAEPRDLTGVGHQHLILSCLEQSEAHDKSPIYQKYIKHLAEVITINNNSSLTQSENRILEILKNTPSIRYDKNAFSNFMLPAFTRGGLTDAGYNKIMEILLHYNVAARFVNALLNTTLLHYPNILQNNLITQSLLTILVEGEDLQKAQAAQALGKLLAPSDAVLKTLAKVAGDQNPFPTASAFSATKALIQLAKVNSNTIEYFWDILEKSHNTAVLKNIIDVLLNHDPNDLIEILKILENKANEILVSTLTNLDLRDSKAVLANKLCQLLNETQNIYIRCGTAHALSKLNNFCPAKERTLLELIQSNELFITREAVVAISRLIKPSQALKMDLIRLTKTATNLLVKSRSIHALAWLQSPSSDIDDVLLDIYNTTANTIVLFDNHDLLKSRSVSLREVENYLDRFEQTLAEFQSSRSIIDDSLQNIAFYREIARTENLYPPVRYRFNHTSSDFKGQLDIFIKAEILKALGHRPYVNTEIQTLFLRIINNRQENSFLRVIAIRECIRLPILNHKFEHALANALNSPDDNIQRAALLVLPIVVNRLKNDSTGVGETALLELTHNQTLFCNSRYGIIGLGRLTYLKDTSVSQLFGLLGETNHFNCRADITRMLAKQWSQLNEHNKNIILQTYTQTQRDYLDESMLDWLLDHLPKVGGKELIKGITYDNLPPRLSLLTLLKLWEKTLYSELLQNFIYICLQEKSPPALIFNGNDLIFQQGLTHYVLKNITPQIAKDLQSLLEGQAKQLRLDEVFVAPLKAPSAYLPLKLNQCGLNDEFISNIQTSGAASLHRMSLVGYTLGYSRKFFKSIKHYIHPLMGPAYKFGLLRDTNPLALVPKHGYSYDEQLDDEHRFKNSSSSPKPIAQPFIVSFLQQATAHIALWQVSYELYQGVCDWWSGAAKQQHLANEKAELEAQRIFEQLKRQYQHHPYAAIYFKVVKDVELMTVQEITRNLAALTPQELKQLAILHRLEQDELNQTLTGLPHDLVEQIAWLADDAYKFRVDRGYSTSEKQWVTTSYLSNSSASFWHFSKTQIEYSSPQAVSIVNSPLEYASPF